MTAPDTNVVRATYATVATYRQSPDTARAAEFDAWLAKVKADARREGQADAWDEGADAYQWNVHHATGPEDEVPNPYRNGAGQ